MSNPIVLMFTRSTVTKSTKTNISLILCIEEPFDRADVRFLLFPEEFDTFLDDLFPFGVREGPEGMKLLTWHAIR